MALRRGWLHRPRELTISARAIAGIESDVVSLQLTKREPRPAGRLAADGNQRCTASPPYRLGGSGKCPRWADDKGRPVASIWAMRVLVVEDGVQLASLIRKGLRAEGLLADVAIKGEDALWMAASSAYDVLTLDARLPGIDGFEVCRRLRDDDVKTPILMLTALDEVEDRIAGLDAGADDYLGKPFDFGELVARLRALARRGPVERDAVLHVADISSTPPRAVCAAEAARSPVGQAVPAAGGLHAESGSGAEPLPSCSRVRGTAGTSTARTSSTFTSATCAKSSTGRSVPGAFEPPRRGLSPSQPMT